jgi:hypothetical protein
MRLLQSILAIAGIVIATLPAAAVDFQEKRKCTLELGAKPLVDTICNVSGRSANGAIDIIASTPDHLKYTIKGPIDGVGGVRFRLQDRPAANIYNSETERNCYVWNDGKLIICFGAALARRVSDGFRIPPTKGD